MMKGQTVINTRVHDNRKRANRKSRWVMHGYYSSLNVLNEFIEHGANRETILAAITTAMEHGPGNKVAYSGAPFVYQGQGYWLRPLSD
jgi:hypothetical protein